MSTFSLSESQLRILLQALAEIPDKGNIVCLDTQYRYLFFNRGHRETMKAAYNVAIEPGRSLLEYVLNEKDYHHAKVNFDRALSGEEVIDLQAYGDNQRSYFESIFRPLRDEQGQIMGLIVYSMNVTIRETEEKVQERKREELEGRFRSTFEQANSIMLLLDHELHIQQVNRAFTEFTGYLNNEAAGQLLTDILKIPSNEFSTFWQINPFKDGQQWKRNLFIWTKNSREVEIALSISGLFNKQGRLVEFIATLRDITLRQQLEKAQQQFMSSISHEIRTPLTNLILYMRLIRQRPEKTEYLDVLDQQIERLQTLMTGVIEISDLTLSKGATSWQMVPLPLVLRSAAEAHRQRAHSRQIAFEVGPLPPDLPPINGDPVRLSQALREIVKNAVNFTPEGGQVTIETNVIQVKNLPWVTIAVRDTGPGISFEEQEYIFGNFFRGQEAERNNIPGAGLGLPMAQAIVKAHGGEIVVDSKPGQGSTFTLWLPTPQVLLSMISS